jgi:DNA polymerase III epsilon subunit-like protein
MKYVSIDLETTGLDWETCQVLEFGAVIDDEVTPIDQLPTFQRIIRRDEVIGSPYAMWLNAELLMKIANADKLPTERFCTEHDLGPQFADWLGKNGIDPDHVVAAGKNFASFDANFLRRVSSFERCVHFKYRVLDPAQLFVLPTDTELPSTAECLRRAGLPDDVAHTAVEDALAVVKLLRIGWERLREKL